MWSKTQHTLMRTHIRLQEPLITIDPMKSVFSLTISYCINSTQNSPEPFRSLYRPTRLSIMFVIYFGKWYWFETVCFHWIVVSFSFNSFGVIGRELCPHSKEEDNHYLYSVSSRMNHLHNISKRVTITYQIFSNVLIQHPLWGTHIDYW